MTTGWLFPGHRGVHQEGVRQEVQPHVALHRGAQLRLVRDARDAPLHLLLPRAGGDPAVQERLGRAPLRSKFFVSIGRNITDARSPPPPHSGRRHPRRGLREEPRPDVLCLFPSDAGHCAAIPAPPALIVCL